MEILNLRRGNLMLSKRGKKPAEIVKKSFYYLLLSIGSLIMVIPFFWMILSSFKLSTEVLSIPMIFFPRKFILDNYQFVFDFLNMGRYYINTSIYAIGVVFLIIISSTWGGYIFAKQEFKGRDLFFIIILSSMMVPFMVRLLPLFLLTVRFRWVNTYQGLILPAAVDAFGIFLMRQFMQEIPSSLVDAARIDGASEVRIYSSIVLPLCKPAMGALGILYFVWTWDSFYWPLIILSSNSMMTLPVGIAKLALHHSPLYGPEMAATTLAVVPMVIVFLLFQKSFIKGITLTGLK